jgi:hypothetical protein
LKNNNNLIYKNIKSIINNQINIISIFEKEKNLNNLNSISIFIVLKEYLNINNIDIARKIFSNIIHKNQFHYYLFFNYYFNNKDLKNYLILFDFLIIENFSCDLKFFIYFIKNIIYLTENVKNDINFNIENLKVFISKYFDNLFNLQSIKQNNHNFQKFLIFLFKFFLKINDFQYSKNLLYKIIQFSSDLKYIDTLIINYLESFKPFNNLSNEYLSFLNELNKLFPNIKPKFFHFNFLFNLFLNNKTELIKIINSMRSLNITPNLDMYNLLIDFYQNVLKDDISTNIFILEKNKL